MATDIRSRWQVELLSHDSWTQHQLLSALCGRDPVGAALSGKLIQRATHLQRAERHVDGAIRAGELTILPSLNNPRLRKVIESIDPKLDDEIGRAMMADRMYGSTYHVRPDVAIRWATAIPGRFPRFPFTEDDLRRQVATNDSVTVNLPYLPRDLATLFDIIRSLSGRQPYPLQRDIALEIGE